MEAGITALAREPAVTDLAIYPPRWTALKLLERDRQICDKVAAGPSGTSLHDILRLTNDRIYHEAGDSADNVIAESRYGFIAGAVRETVRKSMGSRIELTDKIDRAMTHPLLAYPIFLAFMWVLFQATFTLGEYPMRLIELLFSGAGSLVSAHVPPSLLRGLIADGIIAGVGGVLVFLPNILILFMGIAVMEDTGYMARAAFIMDKIMHSIGLHGKSFIPILIGMGCNVPAIMAARTLESERDRIKTILLTPLISCSARLPVYVLFAGSLFPRHAGTVVFLFHFGFSLAAFFGMGFIFKKTLFKEGDYPFVMELPPYRLPTARSVLIHMWQRTRHYLKKMGGVVLVCSVVLWALGTFPLQRATRQALDETARQIRDDGALSDSEKTAALQAHDRAAHARIMSGTYIGRTGRLLEPLVRPLGFDWRGAVALLSGFFAKEIVVSSMSVLYAADGEDGEAAPQLRSAVRRHFSPLAGLAFMTFVLLYTPCVVALVTVVKELKNWKWSAFSVVYQIVFAWVTAFIIYQGGRLVGLR